MNILRKFSSRIHGMIILPSLLLLIALGSLWLHWDEPTVHAAGRIIYVKEGGSGAKNGSSWNHAFGTLQEAINAANDGDRIWIAKGTYYPTKASEPGNPRTREFDLKNGVAIYGGFAGTEAADYDLSKRDFVTNETILDGNHEVYSVVVILGNGNSAILDGVTITGANNDKSSGGAGVNCSLSSRQ